MPPNTLAPVLYVNTWLRGILMFPESHVHGALSTPQLYQMHCMVHQGSFGDPFSNTLKVLHQVLRPVFGTLLSFMFGCILKPTNVLSQRTCVTP
jgi:hypothetical protein